MALSTISARIDSRDKAAFDVFCSEVGLNTSSVINLFVKKVISENRIPFEISIPDPFYSRENQQYILKSVQELRNGKGQNHELIEDAEDE